MRHNDDDDLVAPSITVAQRVLLHLRISVRVGTKMDTKPRIVIQQQQQHQKKHGKKIPFSFARIHISYFQSLCVAWRKWVHSDPKSKSLHHHVCFIFRSSMPLFALV